jgi:hypothetical protein
MLCSNLEIFLNEAYIGVLPEGKAIFAEEHSLLCTPCLTHLEMSTLDRDPCPIIAGSLAPGVWDGPSSQRHVVYGLMFTFSWLMFLAPLSVIHLDNDVHLGAAAANINIFKYATAPQNGTRDLFGNRVVISAALRFILSHVKACQILAWMF